MAVLPPEPGAYGLTFSCHGLKNMDTFSKSDPVVIVRQKVRGVMIDLGKTETIEDDLNPKFSRKVYAEWKGPNESTELQFAVYDVDEDTDLLKNKDLIGMMDIKLGDIIGAPGMTVSKGLKGLKGDENEHKYGLMTVTASEAEAPLIFREGCTAEIFIECQGLKNLDMLSKSDPMCVVSIKRPSGMWKEVGRTETQQDNLNPKFSQTVSVEYTEAVPIELQFAVHCEIKWKKPRSWYKLY